MDPLSAQVNDVLHLAGGLDTHVSDIGRLLGGSGSGNHLVREAQKLGMPSTNLSDSERSLRAATYSLQQHFGDDDDDAHPHAVAAWLTDWGVVGAMLHLTGLHKLNEHYPHDDDNAIARELEFHHTDPEEWAQISELVDAAGPLSDRHANDVLGMLDDANANLGTTLRGLQKAITDKSSLARRGALSAVQALKQAVGKQKGMVQSLAKSIRRHKATATALKRKARIVAASAVRAARATREKGKAVAKRAVRGTRAIREKGKTAVKVTLGKAKAVRALGKAKAVRALKRKIQEKGKAVRDIKRKISRRGGAMVKRALIRDAKDLDDEEEEVEEDIERLYGDLEDYEEDVENFEEDLSGKPPRKRKKKKKRKGKEKEWRVPHDERSWGFDDNVAQFNKVMARMGHKELWQIIDQYYVDVAFEIDIMRQPEYGLLVDLTKTAKRNAKNLALVDTMKKTLNDWERTIPKKYQSMEFRRGDT